MQCPACGHQNRQSARFCGACAAELPLESRCAACGASNPAEQRFCDACGRALDGHTGLLREAPPPSSRPAPASYTPRHLAERILGSRSAIEGERKVVTVLFADIVDSVSLSERSDPEEMHSLMDRCFQAILPEVHRFEGTINQFQGDGFMALFGAPIALEDAPRRACLAALAIHEAVEPLQREVRARHDAELQWRIGIHTGPVVVGRIGDDLRMDYTAVGDTTNLAARLEKAAPPGGILISETTRRGVAGLFDTQDLGSIPLKGKSRPTHVHQLLCERPVSRIEAGARAGLTPLCGRRTELAALRAAFASVQHGRGQVVALVGEAGIGKSRLLHEFRSGLREAPHTFFLGQCMSYGQATFQPIVDGIRRLAGIEDQDDEPTARAGVEQLVRGLGGDLVWTLPFLRDLLALPVADPAVEGMDGLTRRSETVKALNALFLAAAARAPLVFAVEDLHWIDPASEEFLAGLIDSVPAASVLLVLSYRPGYAHPFGERSYFTRVAMQALSDGEMGEMAGALLEGARLPEELRSLIAAKAEGNPLFLEEVTRSLLEEGVLHVRDGSVELARQPGEISIPDRIHDVLMARIDRLGDRPKQAIQLASVIGREFALRLLQRLIEAGDTIQGVIEELRSLELIYQKTTHPELAFMFKHALTHEVAYQSVLVKRRKALHRLVGTAIEELYPDRLPEHYEKLAHHFERAEDWEKALDYHARSAHKAARTYANRAAAAHCREALAIADRLSPPAPPEVRSPLERLLGGCYFVLSEFAPSARAYRLAAEHASDGASRARLLALAAYSLAWAHDYAQANETSDRALALAQASGSAGSESLVLTCHDTLDMTHGGVFDCSRIDEAVRLADQAGDAEALVMALSIRAGRLERTGEFAGAIDACRRALAIARREHLGHMTAFAQWFLAISRCCLGQYGPALAMLADAYALCERIGDRAVRPRLLNTLGWCYAEFNCHELAIQHNERSTVLAREMVDRRMVEGAPELYANGAINLAGNRLALGDADGARRALELVEEQMASDRDPWMRWRYELHLLDARARIALAAGDVETALALAGEERAGAGRSRSRKLEARALELAGRARIVADLRDEAEADLAEALRIADAIAYAPIRWRAPALLAEIDRRRGHTRDAEHHAAQARDLTTRLARTLPSPDLQRGLTQLGESLATDPLTTIP